MTFRQQEDPRPCRSCGPDAQLDPMRDILDGHLPSERACPECGDAWLVLSFEAELVEFATAADRPAAASFLAA
jgi:hypothetical protein